MCDSFVVTLDAARGGGMLFAKNSDRERNEAQALEYVAAAEHAPGSEAKLTYIAIPQAARTNACIISRPCWMWGAEMGANEHGVIIGNEAMHAIVPPNETPALTGMDLLRLALERASSAREALDVIVTLLEHYGQGGNCGHLNPFFYHNGFLIADGRDAYVLETVGRWWAYERVRGPRALSNAYSIGRGYDGVSADLVDHARAQGWLDAHGRFDFAERLTDVAREAVSFGRGRCARGNVLLERHAEQLDAQAMMRILRDHGEEGEAPGWTPRDTKRRSICMHAAEGERRSQTTASMVAEWTPDGVQLWFTASAAPCLSIFKPLLFGAPFPQEAAPLTDHFDNTTRWWRHERLHRAVLREFAQAATFEAERNALEASFASRVASAPTAETIAECWLEADDAETRWLARLPSQGWDSSTYAESWRAHGEIAGLPDKLSPTES